MKEQETSFPMQDAFMHLEVNMPKAKIVIGDSAIHCKVDSLFGGILAYKVNSESDLQTIRNFISKLNEIFM